MAIYQLRTNRSRLGELSVTLIFQLLTLFSWLVSTGFFLFHYIQLGSIIKGLKDYFTLNTQMFFFHF